MSEDVRVSVHDDRSHAAPSAPNRGQFGSHPGLEIQEQIRRIKLGRIRKPTSKITAKIKRLIIGINTNPSDRNQTRVPRGRRASSLLRVKISGGMRTGRRRAGRVPCAEANSKIQPPISRRGRAPTANERGCCNGDTALAAGVDPFLLGDCRNEGNVRCPRSMRNPPVPST